VDELLAVSGRLGPNPLVFSIEAVQRISTAVLSIDLREGRRFAVQTFREVHCAWRSPVKNTSHQICALEQVAPRE